MPEPIDDFICLNTQYTAIETYNIFIKFNKKHLFLLVFIQQRRYKYSLMELLMPKILKLIKISIKTMMMMIMQQ